MKINKNKFYNYFNHVLAGIIRSSLLGINKVKSVLPLNLPRVNKDYLIGFINSHIFSIRSHFNNINRIHFLIQFVMQYYFILFFY
jgi:hypothetical protein